MKKYIPTSLGIIAMILGIAACGGTGTTAPAAASSVVNNEVGAISAQLLKLERAEPPATPSDSANLHVQNAWYTAEGDPNKQWYGELLASTGALIQAYVTQGPAVDASDQVTNPFQAEWNNDDSNNGASVSGVAIGLAEPDGTYDSNSPEMVAISDSGALVRIWVGSGFYIQSDQPFRTTQTPILTENTGVAPSKTNTSGTVNAYVPSAVTP